MIDSELPSLDVRSLKRMGHIEPGQEHLEGVARLEWTSCNFGGARPWFLCPGCGRRVAILYGPDPESEAAEEELLCRHCLKLEYASQRENEITRARRRVEKARARLPERGGRPKGMHRVTFLAAIREYREAVEELECLELAEQTQRRARQLARRRRWRKRSSRERRLGLL